MDIYPAVSTVCSPCPTFAVGVENCGRQSCPYRWQRLGVEDQTRRDERDRKERERVRYEV